MPSCAAIEHLSYYYGLPWRSMFGGRFWIGALLGFASLTSLLLTMRLVGAFRFGALALCSTEIGKWALLYLVVFVLVGLTEEFSARGYALYTLTRMAGYWPAAILTAIVFGYSHVGNSGEDWIGLFNVGLFGLLVCLLLRRTGDVVRKNSVRAGFRVDVTLLHRIAYWFLIFCGAQLLAIPGEKREGQKGKELWMKH